MQTLMNRKTMGNKHWVEGIYKHINGILSMCE